MELNSYAGVLDVHAQRQKCASENTSFIVSRLAYQRDLLMLAKSMTTRYNWRTSCIWDSGYTGTLAVQNLDLDAALITNTRVVGKQTRALESVHPSPIRLGEHTRCRKLSTTLLL